jgi:DNA-directed RNA polymerase specialized sigma24 family protein
LPVVTQEALASLLPLDREALALRHFGRLDRAETAQALGISTDDAAKPYFNALKLLKEVLAAPPGPSEGSRRSRAALGSQPPKLFTQPLEHA